MTPPKPSVASAAAPQRVVVSAGFGRLHLALTAREASDHGRLSMAIMGAYPTPRLRRLTRLLGIADKGRVARLLERDEGIPEEKLRSKLMTELAFEVTRVLARVPLIRRLHPRLHTAVLKMYGRSARRELDRLGGEPKIFHCHAAYGHSSIDRARELGMTVLGDHAIVHPAFIDQLLATRGRLDPAAAAVPRSAHWQAKLADLAKCDAVLVNSEFVRDSFVAAGWSRERVFVAQLGVDEGFMSGLGSVSRAPEQGPLRMLYAGHAERRKGVDVLAEALQHADGFDWRLTLAGPVSPEIATRWSDFFADERVSVLGTVLRPRLRELMLSTPVFVFPSFAEGSARVIFEALACGCYVITTPNSGSIVEDGVHGALVAPGDAEGLIAAIKAADENRERVSEVGNENARLVAREYRQKHYGDALIAIYDELAAAQDRR